MNDKDEFKLKYIAPSEKERKEIESIRREYAEKSDSECKMDELRKMDKKVKRLPKYTAITLGSVGFTMFGIGMSMVLAWEYTITGTLLGLLGATFMTISYFVYMQLLKLAKKKYGHKIILLSDELLSKSVK